MSEDVVMLTRNDIPSRDYPVLRRARLPVYFHLQQSLVIPVATSATWYVQNQNHMH